MSFKLPELPFQMDALEPHISKKTFEFHYGKHHKAYVDILNELIAGTEFEKKSLEDIIVESHNTHHKIFNNAAQHWNHTFFWNCLSPEKIKPSSHLESLLSIEFGSLADFKKEFSATAQNIFGSGWVWLVKTPEGKLKISALKNAENPILEDNSPLLTCDVWEHAYYLDYQNERPKFIRNFWDVVNWEFVEAQIEQPLSSSAKIQNKSAASHYRM